MTQKSGVFLKCSYCGDVIGCSGDSQKSCVPNCTSGKRSMCRKEMNAIIAQQISNAIQRIAKCTVCENKVGTHPTFSSDEEYCSLGFR